MPTENKGILFDNTLVPKYIEYPWAIVKSNDMLGGIHGLTTSVRNDPSTGFGLITQQRRQWGMLAYVWNDNKYYQLVPSVNSIKSDDANWTELKFGGSSTIEWFDSVLDISDNANEINSPKTGDRYLVSANPFGPAFNGPPSNKNKVATYNEAKSDWDFAEPSNGTTLRVDSKPGTLYVFYGTSSVSGKWVTEYQNTVRYIEPTSPNGLTFSYNTPSQHKLTGYTFSTYFASFGTANSGTVSLSIDGNFYAPVKKASSGQLIDLIAGDFESGIRYMMTYDSGNFQIFLPSAGSGIIGQPANGSDYSDGLFTEFTPNTTVGYAIDKINEILKSLAPASAPDLKSWAVSNTSLFAPGKISYTYAQGTSLGFRSTQLSELIPVDQGGLFEKGSPVQRIGIKKLGTSTADNIQGILNSDVIGHPGQPFPAYATYSFGGANDGDLKLYINEVEVDSIDLSSTLSAIDTSSNTTITGFKLTSATNSKFTSGQPLESSWYRTGTFTIRYDDLVSGFNTIQVSHILPSKTLTLNKLEILTDSSTTGTTYDNASVNNYTDKTTKQLSGITYWKTISFQHNQVANNIYQNTYYPGDDAGTFTDESGIQSSAIYNNGTSNTSTSKTTNTPQVANENIMRAFTPTPNALQSLPKPDSVLSPYTFTKKFTTLSGVRRLGGSSTTYITSKRTVQGNYKTPNPLSISGWVIDTFDTTSTTLIENFDDEDKRISLDLYDTVSSVTSATWNSAGSIRTTADLQVADGRLLYPHCNFTSFGDADTNPNKNSGTLANYLNCKLNTTGSLRGTGSRSYIRAFNLGTTPNRAGFKVKINWDATSFVSSGTQLTGVNNGKCILEFKLPYNGTTPFNDLLPKVGNAATGWLDATKATFTNKYNDGDGCLVGTVPGSGGEWIISFGQRNTSHSNGLVLMRFTAGQEWYGHLEDITISY